MIVGEHNWANRRTGAEDAFRLVFCGKTEELDE